MKNGTIVMHRGSQLFGRVIGENDNATVLQGQTMVRVELWIPRSDLAEVPPAYREEKKR